jgi:2'-5' RNA ligase
MTHRLPTPITFAEQVHTGLLVALWLDPDASAELALPGGESADALHVTLCYCPIEDDEADEVAIARAVASLERELGWRGNLTGKVGGYGRFLASDTSDGQDTFYASVDAPGLVELRETVENALMMAGWYPSQAHGFTPHITLAYLAPDADNPVDRLPATKLRFEGVTVMVGDDRRIDIPFSSGWIFAEPASLHPEKGVGKNGQVFHDFRTERTFTGASEWVQFLPAPGTYHHIIYGDMELTAERYSRLVTNFKDGIYGQTLPINCEHDMPASGAIGYIADMRIADDGSIEVRPEWNDRGTALIEGDRFRYVSAEFFESWQDPVSGSWHDDVAFGMAICTNPHFKETVLRPLAASEARPIGPIVPAQRREGESRMTHPTNDPAVSKAGENKATVTLTEAEVTELRDASRRLTAAEQRAEAAEGQVKDLTDRVASMERSARHKRFTELVAGRGGANDGAAWFGDPAKHVATLETLADIAGEDGDAVTTYIEQQQGIAQQLKDSTLFTEVGSSAGGGDENSVEARITALTEERRKADPKLTREQAEAQVYAEHPDLYEAAMKGGN